MCVCACFRIGKSDFKLYMKEKYLRTANKDFFKE